MARYSSRYSRKRAPSGYAPPASPKEPTDPLLEAAILASERRNQLHWSIVADFEWSDKKPGDATRRKIAHFTKLIQLVGDADTAWRAHCASKGVEYRTKPSNTPADLGWLPRYNESLERLRAQLTAELLLGENPETVIQSVDSRVFSILAECAK